MSGTVWRKSVNLGEDEVRIYVRVERQIGDRIERSSERHITVTDTGSYAQRCPAMVSAAIIEINEKIRAAHRL